MRSLTKHRVIDISLGASHSAVLVEPGHVFTLGLNSHGQLGCGNTKPQNAPVEVKTFDENPAQVRLTVNLIHVHTWPGHACTYMYMDMWNLMYMYMYSTRTYVPVYLYM